VSELASYPKRTEGSFPGLKLPGRDADSSLPSRAEIKNGIGIPQFLRASSWLGA
jgi:hypothetical protein